MKKLITLFVFVLSLSSLFAQTAAVDTIKGDLPFTQVAKDKDGKDILDKDGNKISNSASAITKNLTLTKNKIWILRGFIYVRTGATLTIEPGTIIRGDKGTKATIIVARGGKIVAEGTASSPIVFTSNQPIGDRRPGDWGGIIILGKAKNNGVLNNIAGESLIEGGVNTAENDGVHGGSDDNDNSGTLKYVRIEYSGIAFTPNSEINGLTMGSVGKGTKIEYVQVSFNGDDSFEWFGGSADAKYLVSLGTTDDDFDTDNGFSGRVQYAVALRDSRYSDLTGSGTSAGDSNGFESDNDGTGSYNKPFTSPIFSNVSLLGLSDGKQPVGQVFNLGARLRRNTRLSLHNSVIMGFPKTGLFVEQETTAKAAIADSLRIKNVVIAGNGADKGAAAIRPFSVATTTKTAYDWLMTAAFKNDTTTAASTLLEDPFNLLTPNFKPKAGSVLASGAEFTDAALTDAFFDKVAFRGAVGATSTWLNGWTNFNPQQTDYTKLQSAVRELSSDIFAAQIYPNPAQNTATLSFSVEKDMSIAVKVYDLIGREVASKNNVRYVKGTYTMDLNVATLSAGMYIVNFVSAEEGQKSMRLLVTK
jgi:Secretion system C-terminal sorting domain